MVSTYPKSVQLLDSHIHPDIQNDLHGLCVEAEGRWLLFFGWLLTFETTLRVYDQLETISLNGKSSTVVRKDSRFGADSGLVIASTETDLRGLILTPPGYETDARMIRQSVFDEIIKIYIKVNKRK